MENRKYELFLVLPGTLNDQETATRVNELLEIVKATTEGAELHTLGKNRLAYPIKQIRYGYYYTIVFSATPAAVKALEDKMRLTSDILRSMVTYYNTSLTAQQRLAYTTEGMGVVSPADRAPENRPAPEAVVPTTASAVAKLMGDEPAKQTEPKSAVERKIDSTNLEEINKKLDDLMSGDVIPTV